MTDDQRELLFLKTGKVAAVVIEAYAKLKVATAEADALKVQNNALAQNKDVLELRRIEVENIKASRWNGQLPTSIYAGAPVPFMNVH